MAVTFVNKEAYGGRVYPFHTEPVKRDVMGYKLTGIGAGVTVPQGTPLVAQDSTKTAEICKHAKVVKKISTTKFEVEYIGFLAVGDKVFASGQSSPTLSEISAINADTREITLKATNAQIEAGSILVEGELHEGTVSAKHLPNRIVARTQTTTEKDRSISATHQAIVIKNVVDYPEEWLNETTFPGSTLLVGCPLILFVTQ